MNNDTDGLCAVKGSTFAWEDGRGGQNYSVGVR